MIKDMIKTKQLQEELTTNSCQSCLSLHSTQNTIVPPMTLDKITWILFGLGISANTPPAIPNGKNNHKDHLILSYYM